MKLTDEAVLPVAAPDETKILKRQLAVAIREIEDLRIRIQNLLLLYQHEAEFKKRNVVRDIALVTVNHKESSVCCTQSL